MLLVVVKDLLNGLDTRVAVASVVGARLVLLVPVEDTADKGRDESDTRFRAGNGLTEAEEEGQVTVDAVVALELASGLDTLPGGGNLDENAVFLDADGLVESDELLGLSLGSLLVEGQAGVDLGRDTAGDNREDFLTEFDELQEVG